MILKSTFGSKIDFYRPLRAFNLPPCKEGSEFAFVKCREAYFIVTPLKSMQPECLLSTLIEFIATKIDFLSTFEAEKR